jgi:hypothetical protein
MAAEQIGVDAAKASAFRWIMTLPNHHDALSSACPHV